MAYDKGNRPEGGFKRRGGGRRRKKVCVFCGKENNEIDYKDTAKLRKYISERGKILPRRIVENRQCIALAVFCHHSLIFLYVCLFRFAQSCFSDIYLLD